MSNTDASTTTTYSNQTCGPTAQQIGITPNSAIRARSQAIISRRRSQRSTKPPANRPVHIEPTVETAVSSPIWTTEPVASSTNSGNATRANELPNSDIVCPNQKMV